jgi:diguanylate cyclase (GGDEF)-like protein
MTKCHDHVTGRIRTGGRDKGHHVVAVTAGEGAQPGRLTSGVARIRLLVGCLAALVVALYLGPVRAEHTQLGPTTLPWWSIAILFCAAELCLVHVHFRRDAHSFSMSELPLLLALLFASPAGLLAGQVIGSTMALLKRRQSPLKIAFNVAQFTVSASFAILTFDALAGGVTDLGPRAWLAGGAAALVYAATNVLCVSVAISLSEGRPQFGRLQLVLSMAMVGALTNVSFGLVAATVLRYEPAATWLLMVPAAGMFVAYRAYNSEREKHESLEFLYHSTRILNETPEFDQAVLTLLTQARTMFRAETATIALVPPGDDSLLLRSAVGSDGEVTLMQPVPAGSMQVLLDRFGMGESSLLLKAPIEPELQEFLTSNGMRDAMVAALRGETRVVGLIVLGNRLGDVASFDHEDIRLFETLANHASIALENGRLGQSLAKLQELERQLKHLAFHDPLTGLANRSLFAERITNALARNERDPQICGVLFIDLDDFKTVNDTLGHAAGDQLLVAVAHRVSGCLRPGDTGARLGGDEFAVLLENIAGPEDAARVAARVTHSLRLPVQVAGQSVHVRASVGIATSLDVTAADELLRNADLAMYMAKADGKGRFKLFEPSMRAAVVRRHEMKSDLQRATVRGDFSVHYQPFHDLSTGQLVATEALVRWNCPDRGMIYPDSFISLAEETGLIISIGRYVLQEACRQAAVWQNRFPDEPMSMSVNLSPVQFQQQGLLAMVADSLAVSGLRPANLILEITEGVMLQDSEFIIGVLNELRALGVRIAMDDFGTGYSSLSYLRRLPIDILKIAKPLVDGIGEDPSVSAFAQAIVGLGRTLNMQTLAEGIEHPWQARELQALGCELGQGYYFARPMPAADMERILQERHDELDETLATVIAFPA